MSRRGWSPLGLGVTLLALGCSGKTLSSDATSAGGTSGSGGTSAAGGAASSSMTPWWTLPAGSRYFARGGRQVPVLMRNISAPSVSAFMPLLQAAHEAGAKAVRLQLTQGFGYDTLGIDPQGEVLQSWAAS